MIRLFEQHKIRVQKELDGMWRAEVQGKEYTLPAPGCWEQHPELLTYRGKAVYSRKLSLRHRTNLRLEFKGVSHTANVFFDGRQVMRHYNAYTAFDGVLRSVEPGEHELRVEVDNSFCEASSLHVPNDYYTYGGIIRPVLYEELGDVYIRRVHFTPKKTERGWSALVAAEIENIGEEHFAGSVRCSLAGSSQEQTVELAPGEKQIFSMEQQYETVEEWNALDAHLYMLETVLVSETGEALDDLNDRVGFREVAIRGRDFLLNGKKVFLKGFNRHEDYGTLGCAIPVQVMAQDLDMMLEVGSNAVRTCHYPNDERFLDLCDERGVLVWEENHARGFTLERMQNPNFDRQCHDCIEEMVEQHYNHPGIVIWGILNECASETKEGREKYAMQYAQLRSLDSTRPTTSATCRHFKDICLDLPDIVSFNMYSGWYQDVSVKERHEQEMAWIDEAAGSVKPVIVSEFGAAAMYGYRDRGHCKWSEERQADIIRENLEVYREDDRLTGAFIWQFADCKVTEEEWFSTRARCHNNKGVVDEYRRPKEAYDVVGEYFPRMGEARQQP